MELSVIGTRVAHEISSKEAALKDCERKLDFTRAVRLRVLLPSLCGSNT